MIQAELPKLLSQYGINNWKYHDDDNELSIIVLTPSKLGVKKHTYYAWLNPKELTIVGSLESDFEMALKDIKNFVITNRKHIDGYISLIAKLGQFKHKKKRLVYQTSTQGVQNLNDIREYGFKITDQWISWDRYIPIKMIVYQNRQIQVDSEKMKALGYGISSFKVVNDFNFRNGIYCKGLHPNVSMTSKKFCSEPQTDVMRVSLNNLVIVKGLLSHINMNHPYNPQVHLAKLKPFI
jgi:hypothetical protein